MANVFIFIPAFGRQITTTTFESTHALMSAFYQKGILASIASYSWPDIDEARNCALTYWYDCCPDSTHMLMVDADMGFHPNMVLDMLTFGEPMVGAIYPKKCFPIEWVGSGIESPEYRSGFIEVEGLGAGCLLIRRDAVAAMIAKFPEMIYDYVSVPETRFMGAKRTFGFFDSFRIPTGKVSEDIAFCRRYRQTGGKIWGSTGYQIAHVGAYEFSHCFAKEREQKGLAEQQQKQLAVNMEHADDKFTAFLERDAITLQEAQELVPILGAAASHKLRNAIAERMGAPTFDNTVYPDYFSWIRTKHGMFLVNLNDAYIGRSLIEYGEWCEFEIELLGKFVGTADLIVDVGANIGTHAVAFAKMVGAEGKVVAFEPQPRLVDTLRKNVRANGYAKIVDIHLSAAGPEDGSTFVPALPPDNQEFNFGMMSLRASGANGAPGKMETIDSLGILPRLIKIDVEGMEAEVLQGARGTIADAQPILYVECNSDDTSDIARVLNDIGYRAYWSIGPYFNPNNYFRSAKDIWPGVDPSANLLAIPMSATPLVMLEYLGAEDNWRKAVARMETPFDGQSAA